MKKIGHFLLKMMMGVNGIAIALMLLSGYSDHIDPERFPLLACMGLVFPFLLLANLAFLVFWVFVCWRKMWLPLAGLALACVPISIYIPLNSPQQPAENSLKVLSYNVHAFSGMVWGQDIFDSVFHYICRQQPDIVCLQEGHDSWRHSERKFAEIFAYNDSVRISTNARKSINSIQLHSRYPILRKERIPVSSDTEMNGAAAFYLDYEGDTLLVVGCHLENVHLDTKDRRKYKVILKGEMQRDTARSESRLLVEKLSGAFAVRARQAKEIRDYIGQHAHGHPVIVCGDFNDTPISYVRRHLCGGMADVFVECGRGLGLSYNQKGFNFRIDHLFCSDHFVPQYCIIDAKMGPSDHYPLVCWLKKRDKP